jgi:tetratricopeptide (TPR) repeat protein
MTAASSLGEHGRHQEAFAWLQLARRQDAGESSMRRIGDALLASASGLLNENDWTRSRDAYQLAIDTLVQFDPASTISLATARLGLAWTMVMLANSGDDAETIRAALNATDDFLQQHPEHADASSALLLKLSCQTRLKDEDGSVVTQTEILRRHPNTMAANDVLKMRCRWQSELTEIPEVVRQHLMTHVDLILASPIVGSNVDILACGLLAAGALGHAHAETAYSVALSLSDETGDASTYVLEHLQTAGHDAAASRIAIQWIAARGADSLAPSLAQMQDQAGRLITTATREAACRWAGRNGQWKMLALAANDETGLFDSESHNQLHNAQLSSDQLSSDQLSVQESDAPFTVAQKRGRSLHVERLFAEALLQTGSPKQSLKLWQHIVDRGGADDFPTLLRTAETAVAAGSISDASVRIAAAKAAALNANPDSPSGTRNSAQVALTDLLAANLEIRQLRFDRGRALLEQVVRSSESGADLRGRAQWMIGETFFMQQKFPEAIAAYRQVEAISESDDWTAAALVQAGKSFEQLGRTREATVCYSTLVSRFGQSRHATGARRRLAAMTTNDPNSQPIRR